MEWKHLAAVLALSCAPARTPDVEASRTASEPAPSWWIALESCLQSIRDKPLDRLELERSVDAFLSRSYPLAWADEPYETNSTFAGRELRGLPGLERSSPWTSVTCVPRDLWAWRTGFLPGDRLVSVNGESLVGEGPVLARYHIRTLAESRAPLQLVVQRPTASGRWRPVELTSPPVGDADWHYPPRPPMPREYFADQNTLYIDVGGLRLEGDDEIRGILEAHPAAKALVLDLRNCGGGLLKTVVGCAGLFSAEGVLFRLSSLPDPLGDPGRPRREDKLFRADVPGPFHGRYRLVVLVGLGTTRSMEAFAQTMRDAAGARIIGSPTPRLARIHRYCLLREKPEWLGIFVPIAEHFGRDGRSIARNGVTLDEEVPMTLDRSRLWTGSTEGDVQLQRALAYCREGN